MADDWTQTTFAELVASKALLIGDGYRAKNEELGGTGPVFLRGGLIQEDRIHFEKAERFHEHLLPKLQQKLTQPYDVVVTTKGWSTGRTCFFLPDYPQSVYSPHLSFWRSLDRTRLDPQFLRQWSRSPPFVRQLESLGGTCTLHPYLNLRAQYQLEIELPPIEEQRRIAAVLGALDDKIELNRKMSRTLEEMAQALFKSWFIDFDGHEDLVDSEFGPIPRGWSVGTLGDFIRIRRGLSYKGAHLTDHGTPMVNLKCIMSGGGFRHDGLKHYDGPFKEKHVVRPGDLVIANTDLTQAREVLGCPAIVPRLSSEPIIASHHIYITEPASSLSLPNAFLYYLLKSPQLRDRCQGFASGTTVLAITPDVIEQAPFVVPPAKKAQEFVVLADALHLRMSLNHEESRTLSALRDLLLPKLISGELRVPESLPLP